MINAKSSSSSISRGGIQSVERALDILTLFKENSELGITQISGILGLPKGTVHGLVKTLEERGFLEKDPENKRYRCGLEAFKLGISMAMRMDVRQIASERAQSLCNEIQETVHLAVLIDGMCVNIDRFSPLKPFMLIPQLGSAVPAHCTATGKVLLSQLNEEQLDAIIERSGLVRYTKYTITEIDILKEQLQEVRAKGYAISNQEALVGLSCMAAPIRDYTGAIAAAISIAGSTETIMEEKRFKTVVAATKAAADDISKKLGYESD